MPIPTEPITAAGVAWALAVVLGFTLALFVATRFLPGTVYEGFPQPGGARNRYKLNGMYLFILVHAAMALGVLALGFDPSILVRRFWHLFIAANIVSVAWTAALYVTGRAKQRPEERGHGALALVKDLWFGNELNPTWAQVDQKIFAYQPSLLGLGLLNVAFAFAQYKAYGVITTRMALYQSFWWAYLLTHYYYEPGILSMWDIIAEKFGFMLVWGDMVLVPFFYCIGGWWLVSNHEPMSVVTAAAVSTLFLLGLYVFRGSNAQKHRFKLDPSKPIWGRAPEVLGGKLLVSGFWGLGRKINYTGEICVYTAIALTTGFGSIGPYILPLWLITLLSHRAWRDEQRCRAKYGALWEAYCQRARFRMVPFLY